VALRPCIDCGALAPRTRCPPCATPVERARNQAKQTRRPERSNAERQRRAQAVAAHRATYGDWCPGWQRPPHPAADLTADHIVGVIGSGGAEDGPLQVLCRPCNSRKRT
jgi:5-methylcytosine-specific restriction protein A